MELTDDWGGAVDTSSLAPPIGPPLALLWSAAAVLLVAIALSVPPVTMSRLAAYALAAIVTSSLVGAFRYVDSRRRARATYRDVASATLLSVGLLVVGWVLSGIDAWLVATAWAR